jgi:hypothetical protein
MNRILRRPMFKMGGTPNEGIMTGLKEPRVGYQRGAGPGFEELIAGETLKQQRGPYFTEPFIQNKFEEFKTDLFKDPNEGILTDTGIGSLGGYGFIEAPESPKTSAAKRLIQEQPEKAYKLFKEGKLDGTKYGQEQTRQKTIAKDAGLKIDFGLELDDKPEVKPNKKIAGTTGNKVNKLDTGGANLEEYINMFKTAVGGEEDDAKRDKFLQLAKFGTNLLAQPGGNLVSAIGRAAQEPLKGLERSAARKQETERQAKLLGTKAFVEQMDDPTLKKLRMYSRLTGRDLKDSAEVLFGTASDRKTEALVEADFAKGALDDGLVLSTNASKVYAKDATKMIDSGDENLINILGRLKKFNKDTAKEGEYYVAPNGRVGRFTGDSEKPFLQINDTGFLD